MVLLLDLVTYIIDRSDHSGPLTEEEILNGYNEIYEDLSAISEDNLLSQVTEIEILICTFGLFSIEEAIYKKFLKKIKRKSSALVSLMEQTKFTTYDSENNYFEIIFDHVTKDKQYVFFDTFLSLTTSVILACSQNVVGYRLIKAGDEQEWEEIKNINKYLTICILLIADKKSYKPDFQKVKQLVNERGRSEFISNFITSMEQEKILKHFCLFKDEDSEEFEEFKSKILSRFDSYEPCSCKKENFKLPKNAERLVIFDFNVLPEDQQIKNLKDTLFGEYKEKLVIIFSETFIDLQAFPQFRVWVPTTTSYGIAEVIIEGMKFGTKLLEQKIGEFNYFIDRICDNDRSKKKLYDKLKEYSPGNNELDVYAVDFWYDMDSVDFNDFDKENKIARDFEQKYFPKAEQIRYKFYITGRKVFIEENGKIDLNKEDKNKREIDFFKSKGIRYILYMIKYHGVNNPSNYKNLCKVISKWMGNGEKEVKYNSFRESIKDVFDKHPVLKPIDKFLFYPDSQKDGCYYQENSEIEIDLSAIEIPILI